MAPATRTRLQTASTSGSRNSGRMFVHQIAGHTLSHTWADAPHNYGPTRGLPRSRSGLERFSHGRKASPQCRNQPWAATPVIGTRASVMALSRSSRGRVLAVCGAVFTLDQHGSMGDRAGEYGGKDSRRAACLAMACWLPTALGARRLSIPLRLQSVWDPAPASQRDDRHPCRSPRRRA